MSFVTTDPEALTVAAGNLQGIGSAMAAQNAAAATSTTGLAPAAADEVSALQATQFAAYGTLYQQISAQATAIHDLFVHTLRASADSYGATESANSAAAAASGAGVSGGGLAGSALAGAGVSNSLSAYPPFGLGGAVSNSAILAAMQAGTIGSATSEFTGLGKGYITAPPGVVHRGADLDEAVLANASAPASPATGPAAAAEAPVPVAAGAGQAPSVGNLSVPPSWAGEAVPVSGAVPAAPAGAGLATAATAPHSTAVSAVPAGMPAIASAGRGGPRFGTPRYGVKPRVMPRDTAD